MAIAPWTSAARSRPCSAFSWKPALSRAIDEVAAGIVLDVLTLMRGRECPAEIDKAAWALMRRQCRLSGCPFRSARCDGRHGATGGVVLNMLSTRPGGQEFPRCLIINGHMRCGSRFPLKQKRSFPILAVMPTLKLAGAPEKQAMTPWRGTGALSQRKSPAGRAGAHPCSTPYSVKQEDKNPRSQCTP
jgi:hypothetical protein